MVESVESDIVSVLESASIYSRRKRLEAAAHIMGTKPPYPMILKRCCSARVRLLSP